MRVLAYVHLRNIYRSTGAGRVAREMTEHLARTPGVELEVLADPADHRRVIEQVGAPWTDFRYHFIRNETSRQQARWYLLNSPNAEKYWPGVDITYCAGESYVPSGKSRLVVTVHDAQAFDNGAHRLNTALFKQRVKWSLLFSRLSRTTDLFHTVSNFSAERLAHHFPSISSRLRVVPNAVSSRFFEQCLQPNRRLPDRLHLGSGPFVLVPGGLHFRKNADLILNAWPVLKSKHPDLKLVVINHCDPTYAERARTAKDVILAGFLDDDELCAMYQAATVTWFPSLYEGFGMPVLEAMACGSPVVTSNSTSLPEVAGDAAILVPPDRPAEHIDAISALLDSAAMREDLSARGRRRAQDFTWKRSAEQLAGHFASLV